MTDPQHTDNLSAFSSAATEARHVARSDAREACTSEERNVLALELIADQLVLIHADLCAINDVALAGTARNGSAPGRDQDAEQDRWDNEGGGTADRAALYPDDTYSVEQHYAVGGYHYTNLQHAIAEAKRTRRAAAP